MIARWGVKKLDLDGMIDALAAFESARWSERDLLSKQKRPTTKAKMT